LTFKKYPEEKIKDKIIEWINFCGEGDNILKDKRIFEMIFNGFEDKNKVSDIIYFIFGNIPYF
jgi:hypothetical protein